MRWHSSGAQSSSLSEASQSPSWSRQKRTRSIFSVAWPGPSKYVATSSARSKMRDGLAMTRTSDTELLLLDTHVWLWLVAGSPELSTRAQQKIGEAAAAGALRIAAISLWEIALLASRGRIALGKSIGLWLDEALAEP